MGLAGACHGKASVITFIRHVAPWGTSCLLLACCLGCAKLGPFRSATVTPEVPGDVLGYGPVNHWMLVDPHALATALAAAGCNTTHIEFLGWAETSQYENPALLYPKAKAFIGAMRAQGITTFVNLCNSNVGSGKYGDQEARLSSRNAAWFQPVLDFWQYEIGPDHIILQAVSEWGDGREFVEMTHEQWPGRVSWNQGSRPTCTPDGYWALDYHPFHITDIGPTGTQTIVVTDTGAILHELGGFQQHADPKVLEDYARRCHQAGRGFLYYGFGHTTIDHKAIRAIGRAPRSP